MDWEPRVGMRVVCVNARPIDVGMFGFNASGLVEGTVYTIRWAGLFPFVGELHSALRLSEYIRDDEDTPVGAIRFRPLDERRLDIFRAVLTKAPTPEKEPA